jgi:serine protease Do
MRRLQFLALGLLATLVIGTVLFCRATDTPAAPGNPKIWTETPAEAPVVPPGFAPTRGFAPLVQKVKPAVVNIYTTMVVKRPRLQGFSPFEDFFLGDPRQRGFGDDGVPMKRNSLGSGFIINPDGYVLTNNHVVAEASEIRVKLDSGKEYLAKVVGRDERYDLALIKVEPDGKLPAVPFGDSDKLEVGDWVIAFGNPYGLAHTVTAGIVSAKDRVIGAGPYDDFIQTDASINPGNSGGPLFDAGGVVVGINTAIHSSGQGIGFAVPVNMAKSFIRDVMTKGRVTRGWLGVGIQDLTPELAKGLGLPTTSGVLVSQVYPASPAEKAGVKAGDVILEFSGKRVDKGSDLTRLVGTTAPGDVADLKILRDSKEIVIKTAITERKGDANVAASGGDEGGALASNLGLKVAPIGEREAARQGVRRGAVVREVADSGPAAEAGIREGDVILEVNRAPIGSAEEFATAVARIGSGDSVLLLVVRGTSHFYAVVRKP